MASVVVILLGAKHSFLLSRAVSRGALDQAASRIRVDLSHSWERTIAVIIIDGQFTRCSFSWTTVVDGPRFLLEFPENSGRVSSRNMAAVLNSTLYSCIEY